ncbi:MAG: hypothetical protein WCA35_06985, partial [Kovacikia sp.]
KLEASEARAAASEARVTALENDKQQLANERERERVTSFVEKLASNDVRKVLPSEVQEKIQIALAIPNDTKLEFSEAGETVEKTPRQRYLDSLAAGKPLWSNQAMSTGPADAPSQFGELPPNIQVEGLDPESIRQEQQIQAKAKEMGKDLTNYSERIEVMNALNLRY